MKKYFSLLLLTLLSVALISCNNTNSQDYLTIKSGKTDIEVKQDDTITEIDNDTEVFKSLVDESVYLELGSAISLTIDTNSDVLIYEYILNEDGMLKYNKLSPSEIEVTKKANVYSYTLGWNIGDGLSSVTLEVSIRGYHVIIGENHYFYVVQTEPTGI